MSTCKQGQCQEPCWSTALVCFYHYKLAQNQSSKSKDPQEKARLSSVRDSLRRIYKDGGIPALMAAYPTPEKPPAAPRARKRLKTSHASSSSSSSQAPREQAMVTEEMKLMNANLNQLKVTRKDSEVRKEIRTDGSSVVHERHVERIEERLSLQIQQMTIAKTAFVDRVARDETEYLNNFARNPKRMRLRAGALMLEGLYGGSDRERLVKCLERHRANLEEISTRCGFYRPDDANARFAVYEAWLRGCARYAANAGYESDVAQAFAEASRIYRAAQASPFLDASGGFSRTFYDQDHDEEEEMSSEARWCLDPWRVVQLAGLQDHEQNQARQTLELLFRFVSGELAEMKTQLLSMQLTARVLRPPKLQEDEDEDKDEEEEEDEEEKEKRESSSSSSRARSRSRARSKVKTRTGDDKEKEREREVVMIETPLAFTTENKFMHAFGMRWMDFAHGGAVKNVNPYLWVRIAGQKMDTEPHVWVRVLVGLGGRRVEAVLLREIAALLFRQPFLQWHSEKLAPSLAQELLRPRRGEPLVGTSQEVLVPLRLLESAPEFHEMRGEIQKHQTDERKRYDLERKRLEFARNHHVHAQAQVASILDDASALEKAFKANELQRELVRELFEHEEALVAEEMVIQDQQEREEAEDDERRYRLL